MGSSSRHSRKRKQEDEDTSEEGRARRERQEREALAREARESRSRSRSESPKEKRPRKKERDSPPKDAGNDEPAESMSIEDTNKLRAKLGLAPLDTDDAPKITEQEDGSMLVNEDGFEFKHKAPENWGAKKQQQEISEKLADAKKKRQLFDKMNRVKGLAESDSDDDGATGWVEKMRQAEEEKKKAAERERALAEMDENFGIGDIIEKSKVKEKKPKTKKKAADTGGLVIGHSKEQFMGMQDQILVLGDKSVLDEGDETLINPNMIENEMHAKNVELRKRKAFAKGYEAGLDEFGNPKDMGLLAKYDEELEGVQKEKFRLDEKGCYDLTQDEREAEIKRQLSLTGKEYISLVMPDSQVGSDFYTQEEMISFRKPKKGGKKDKLRKRGKKGMLKADDLIPDEPSGSNFGSRDRGRRRNVEDAGSGDDQDMEVKTEGADEDEEGDGKWKKVVQQSVDYDSLRKLAQAAESDEDSEEEFGNADLAGVVIDDDAHDELSSILDKARKMNQKPVKTENDPAQEVQRMMNAHGIKMEIEDEDETPVADEQDGAMCIDSTMEYCRSIGENMTYGLAGNRDDAIEMDEEEEIKEEVEEEVVIAKVKEEQVAREKTKKTKKVKVDRGGWTQPAGTSADAELDSDDEKALAEAQDYERSDSDDEDEDYKNGEYENVLGKEADVSKGVGAMLKLAAEKGYLNDPNASKHSGQNLDHLRNQAKTQIECGKYDIEDKYVKKLDRLGVTGRGPITTFTEKKDYKPDVQLEYVDNKGRAMDAKDAYRQLSYKFHGRMPGKKQTEKRSIQRDKKELLKQMNSSDTPLGTLSKQLKKQEQLQTPYLVLSGSGRSDHTSIKKE